ncbi:hypothetical protein [Jeotgalibacillus haloalkalitolerans]|uniref:Uncharacterized protein n=1 Tax=Jeotgalibacillus haloalkalitolerans TaxID=3104292 RepID=A0ABU5KIT0_9BACL|nr:hypothetical protein [Jeotgalibacillus sp. HH7-29]MDZ5710831.1 hypothetical protein [Jeotgalibacillus sp. HH7-29]
MNVKKLNHLEINISGTSGTSYRTIIDFEKSYILRSGIVNNEKVDLKPAMLNDIEKDRLREKLSHLSIESLKHIQGRVKENSELYWQVIATGDDETLQEVGVNQLPLEWNNFFRLLP